MGKAMINNIKETYDIIIVGAGHAGCEAALASARLGLKTIVFTVSVDSIALMPCNPNVGGTSKGHLVRELDALGGQMGINIDKTFIQSKMLNSSKGPAVHSLRAQADKQAYTRQMRKTLESTEGLTIKQAEVSEIIVEDGICKGVKTFSGATYFAKCTVLTTGTYLKSRCLYGEVIENTGPNGLKNAPHLSDSLSAAGIELRRFKTGTPARIDGSTINYSKMEAQKGDVPVVPFSFTTDPSAVQIEQVDCYLTYTNEKTHNIIRENISRSPLYSGEIKGVGPRYCPSIEDKVMKFPEKNRHQIFVEPEGLYTHEMYLSGMSSSLPEDVQYAVIHSVPGLENAKIVRNAYAIEYDCIDARQLSHSLEFKNIKNLFAGGQFNGSSGYEEAAVQGFIAGVNAARKAKELPAFTLDRSEAYIGVLIDDLVTKESKEPYRMMTSRSEYRLLLRQDNADLRLTEKGYEIGLISEERYKKLLDKRKAIEEEIARINSLHIGANVRVQKFLREHNSSELGTSATLAELVRRPELNYDMLSEIDDKRPTLPFDVREQINIEVKYDGYISRQRSQVHQFKKMEAKKIPNDIDYTKIGSLRIEAVQKLSRVRPESVGQAARISGVSPADISVLLVYLETIAEKEDRKDRPNKNTISAMIEAEQIMSDPSVKKYDDVEEALKELKK